jgi:hypothetical protein
MIWMDNGKCRYLTRCEHAGSKRCKACRAIQADIDSKYRLKPHRHVPAHVVDNIAAQEREITPLELMRGMPIAEAFVLLCRNAWGMSHREIVEAAELIANIQHPMQSHRLELRAKARKPA